MNATSPTPTATFANPFSLQLTQDYIANHVNNKPTTPSGQVFAKLVLMTNVTGLPQEVEIKNTRFRIGRDRNQVDMYVNFKLLLISN
jgi:hypothetical protein